MTNASALSEKKPPLGGDQDLVFTFSNPALKSAVGKTFFTANLDKININKILVRTRQHSLFNN